MSHSFVAVIVPPDTLDINVKVDELMAPFQENNMGDCPEKYLKFNDVEDDSRKQFETKKTERIRLKDGTLKSPYEDEFKAPVKVPSDPFAKTEYVYPKGSHKVKVLLSESYATFEEYMKDYEGYKERDKKTGRYGYWENPNKKWDWWQIGGRWTAAFAGDDYDPSKDRKNMEVCWLCRGTGKRKDMVSVNGCNGCEGTGIAVKWPTQWAQHEGNVALVKTAIGKVTPFAVVTPEGEWIEKGQMGWWGIVQNEEDEEAWKASVMKIFNKYLDHKVVAVDCHI